MRTIVCLLLLPAILEASDAKWLGVPTLEERQAGREKMKAAFYDLGVGHLPVAQSAFPISRSPGSHPREKGND